MASTDIEILNRALNYETKRGPQAWDAASIGASRQDINRLLQGELIEQKARSSRIQTGVYGPALYRLTERGRRLAAGQDEAWPTVTEDEVVEAMSHIVGFEDIKCQLAFNIAEGKRIHSLLEGPPASVKSTILEAIRNCVPGAEMVFGSRSSGRGLSDMLFEKKPRILLLDEADKMFHDVFSLTLGLMEAGEIIETKSGATRGIKLNTMVIAACNSSKKMPAEFISRFASHFTFPHYTRPEFIDVVRSMLGRAEGCPAALAEMIACQVFDNRLGDVRQARGVWQQMRAPTEAEAIRVLNMKAKYSVVPRVPGRKIAAQLL